MGDAKSTGWSKAAQRRAAGRYGRGRKLTPVAPEDKGQQHEAETEQKENGS